MYENPTRARAATSARSVGADSRRKGGRLQSACGPASRPALVVPGDGLNRKRIVRTAEVTIETEESVVLRGSLDQRSTQSGARSVVVGSRWLHLGRQPDSPTL